MWVGKFRVRVGVGMGVNPGVNPQFFFFFIALSIVKNICMYT